MIVRMLMACSPVTLQPADLDAVDSLMVLFGRYFQIRDDYANLVSPEVGTCTPTASLPTASLIQVPCTDALSTSSTPRRKGFAKTSTKANAAMS